MTDEDLFSARLQRAVIAPGVGARLSSSSTRSSIAGGNAGTGGDVATRLGEGGTTLRLFVFDVDPFDDERTFFGDDKIPA